LLLPNKSVLNYSLSIPILKVGHTNCFSFHITNMANMIKLANIIIMLIM